MTVRSIINGYKNEQRLDQTGQTSPQLQDYLACVNEWTKQGLITPTDSILFETDKGFIGGICFCEQSPTTLRILNFTVDKITFSTYKLILDAINQAKRPQTQKIIYNLYSDEPNYNAIIKLFERANFAVAQHKHRYTYNAKKLLTTSNNSNMIFKNVLETGEKLFIETVRKVTQNTLDKIMLEDAQIMGEQAAAEDYVQQMKKISFKPSWWRLAYVDGVLVGLILPQAFNQTEGAINYIGVIPEHRGKGYVLPLAAEATNLLLKNGISQIYADIDTANTPLANALAKLGYFRQLDESVLINIVTQI
ncbi:MAG: GNAT family N-acetyltransferase [Defluviitaleaceae bacterium]|nr:GNAT family N-acetyltransferase [Defluviitaleaceae bacterium]